MVLDIIERQELYEVAFLVDDDVNLKNMDICGYQVIGGKTELAASGVKQGIVAIGNNHARSSLAEWLIVNGLNLVSVVHPSAQLGRGVMLGAGTVVMAGAVINSDSIIGRNVIVNTHASIDHDCIIGNGAHIAPGTTLCGNVRVGDGTLIGAGATIIPNLTIGNNVLVGAGAVVIGNIPHEVTIISNPARVLK